MATLASVMPTFSAPRHGKQPDSPEGVRAVAALPPAVGVVYDGHLAFESCTCAVVYCVFAAIEFCCWCLVGRKSRIRRGAKDGSTMTQAFDFRGVKGKEPQEVSKDVEAACFEDDTGWP